MCLVLNCSSFSLQMHAGSRFKIRAVYNEIQVSKLFLCWVYMKVTLSKCLVALCSMPIQTTVAQGSRCGRGWLCMFYLSLPPPPIVSLFFHPLSKTARYRPKYCLKICSTKQQPTKRSNSEILNITTVKKITEMHSNIT